MSEISQTVEGDGQRSMLSRIFSVMEGRHYHEVFREYAAAKNLNSECPSCGKRDWWVTPPPREGYTPGENIIAKNAAGEGAVGFAPKMMLNDRQYREN